MSEQNLEDDTEGAPMFPSGQYNQWDRLLPLAIMAGALTDVALAGLAYRYNVAATVRAIQALSRPPRKAECQVPP